MFRLKKNEQVRQKWLRDTLEGLAVGGTILDAGAGELKNKIYCSHLSYSSQDFCEYGGSEKGVLDAGLQNEHWDTSKIDLVCDIVDIPVDDCAYDYVLCSEVLEHVPDPVKAVAELSRILKPGGKLILTAPFASLVHMAPYHYCSGFSRYWYEHHLERLGLDIEQLCSNGDWFNFTLQEILRLGSQERKAGSYAWPVAYMIGFISVAYSYFRNGKPNHDLACIGWHCIATKRL